MNALGSALVAGAAIGAGLAALILAFGVWRRRRALSESHHPVTVLRVYLAFVTIPDGGGDAFAVIALYDDRRIEVRILRSGTIPLYGIYVLSDGGAA